MNGIYVVFKHFTGTEKLLFGGVFSTREKAEEVCKRENQKLGEKHQHEWYDFIHDTIDYDFMADA